MMMMMMMMKWGGKIYRTSLSPRSQTNNLFTLKIRVGSVCKQTCYLYDPLSLRFNCSIERSKEIDRWVKIGIKGEGEEKICKRNVTELRP